MIILFRRVCFCWIDCYVYDEDATCMMLLGNSGCFWLVANSWKVSNVILEYQHDLFEYDVVWLVISSSENLF